MGGTTLKFLGCLLDWIDRSIERADQRRIERTLAQSADMTELAARMRDITYRYMGTLK